MKLKILKITFYISKMLLWLNYLKCNCPTKVFSTPLLNKINIKRVKRDSVNIFILSFHKYRFWLKTVNFRKKKSYWIFLQSFFLPINNHINEILPKMFRYWDNSENWEKKWFFHYIWPCSMDLNFLKLFFFILFTVKLTWMTI